MKGILFAAATLAACLFATQTSKAADVSVDFFYNNLSGGSWIEVGDYGYVWQPDLAVSDPAWRPYADGYWAYTDLGWTWVSYEDFGWATYHYGRWARLADYGWVWVPGRDEDLEWGPAWVSWRYGGDYVGWAPLPPETIGVVYAGRPVTGDIDIEFNVGPACYNFVDVRYIGEPVLRERIVDYRQNVTYINQTVNITNITYKNKVVYNYGPDVTVLNARAARPVQRLKIERQENVDVAAAAKSGGLMKPQGDRLVVAAPMHITKAQRQVAPPQVKTKVAKANLDRGWSVVGDENAQNQFKQQLKQQQSRKQEILTRSNANTNKGAGANADAQTGASASPQARASAVAGGPPDERDRGRGRGRNRGAERLGQQNPNAGANANANANAGPNANANVSPGASAAPNEPGTRPGARGRNRGRNADQFNLNRNANEPPAAGADANAAAGASPNAPPQDQTGAGADRANASAGADERARRFEQQQRQGQQFGQGNANQNAGRDQNDRRGRGRRFDQPPGAQGNQANEGNQPNEFQGRRRGAENQEPGAQVGQGQDRDQRPHPGRGRNRPEASPSATPKV